MSDNGKPKISYTTPFPNELFDNAMPRLNDTQWRVLCVIVRQTLGWYDPQTGNRKNRDWLSQSQLKVRTGRNAQALATAIDMLVKQGYIVVENEIGSPLDSPLKRRAYRGRCYYRLSDGWLRRVGLSIAKMPDKTSMQTAHAIFQLQVRKTEFDSSGKSNRTKEKLTKETEFTVPQPPLSVDKLNGLAFAQLQEFIDLFTKTAKEYWDTPADTMLAPGQLANLKRLLETHTGIDWQPHLQAFFVSDFQYVKQHRYALSAFLNMANVLLLMKSPPPTANSSSVSPKNV